MLDTDTLPGEALPLPAVARDGAGWPLLRVLRAVRSPELGNERDIVVALPPRYAEQPERRWPVLYLQDGQNLIDPAASYAGHWQVGETLAYWAPRGVEAIVVAIPNMGAERLQEYGAFADPRHGGGRGGRYARFVVETLKRRIDEEFRTVAGPEGTVMGGSSMGGLISLVTGALFPHAIGTVLVMSPSLWYAQWRVFDWLEARPHLPRRIHLDVGLAEPDEEIYDVRRLARWLLDHEYTVPGTLRFIEAEEEGHNEAAWARRFREALPWLVGAG
ncbi:MAG: alpha/beta hydrolase-fold protein [Gemmatimonadales bacterium]|nr:alpha/beta hydrolase-fold protein [Gemmatimonadales bacterium]